MLRAIVMEPTSAESWKIVSIPSAAVAQLDVGALPSEGPAVGRDDARHHLDERRLAGAVVAEETDDLRLPDREVDIGQGVHLPVVLRDAPQLQELRHQVPLVRMTEYAAAAAMTRAPTNASR
jgi:hypothetical protein